MESEPGWANAEPSPEGDLPGAETLDDDGSDSGVREAEVDQ